MHVYDLSNDWQLRGESLHVDNNAFGAIADRKEGWLAVKTLPCDVHQPLIDAQMIGDPLVADNCFKCEWIEDRSWWFRKTFTAGNELLHSDNSELVIEGLDVHADLFLNGVYLGHHRSAMYPFRKDMRDVLRDGENVLIVRVTSGLERYSDFDLSKIKDYVSCEYKRGRALRGDNRRALVRKPQYVYGWDWTPRIATCGITGHARLEAYRSVVIRHVKFATKELTPQGARISVEAEVENLCTISTLDAVVKLDIRHQDAPAVSMEKEVFLTSGLNYVGFDAVIANPALWWPNGMGEQNLYWVTVTAETSDRHSDAHQFRTGIRTVRLNTDRIDDKNRLFAFEINGIRTFCKGGNWETPDSIYARVSDEKYEILVKEAREANFNMLRVNGCNDYPRDFFYDCCDRYGILVWQDFAFSCAAYPDELDWFRQEVEHEVEYQTRRLANHPCIALWCGNNECQGHLVTYLQKSYWAGDKKPVSPGGMILYNEIIPRIARRNAPRIPYWNSSPYGGASDMDCNEVGDRHHWIFMSHAMEERISPEEYDKVASKFVSEFGCVGPTKKSSLIKYFGGEEVSLNHPLWKLHTNTFEKGAVAAGIAKHYADPENISLDEYLLYAGLFQGVMLGYALESMRCAENNSGALLWSYNNAWGELGWSIIDYYRTRKIAYYFVKRSLAHQKLVVREADGQLQIICLNDTPETAQLDLEYGYLSFDGEEQDTATAAITIEPFGKTRVPTRLPTDSHDPLQGVYYARVQNPQGVLPAVLRKVDFRALQVPRPTLRIADVQDCAESVSFSVSSDKYAHGAHFGFDDSVRLSDEYFDLLPGETRRIRATGDHRPLSISDTDAHCIGKTSAKVTCTGTGRR